VKRSGVLKEGRIESAYGHRVQSANVQEVEQNWLPGTANNLWDGGGGGGMERLKKEGAVTRETKKRTRVVTKRTFAKMGRRGGGNSKRHLKHLVQIEGNEKKYTQKTLEKTGETKRARARFFTVKEQEGGK